MANATCPTPFLDYTSYPSAQGFIRGRFCGPFSENLYCCLPCPLSQWVYTDAFKRKASIAYWFNVPAFVAQVFLLVTFAVLSVEKSHRHYMSVGLVLSVMMLELAFIIPLGTKPDQCYNAITPRDMRSSMSCAWTGALLEVGAMSAVVWILLRSLWTHLRVCWDVKHTPMYMWLAHALGWGLPALFLAISLPVTGVSYRLGGTCFPNPHGAFVTWFGWLIAFAYLGALIQFITTGFGIVLYARSVLGHSNSRDNTSSTTSSSSPVTPSMPQSSFGGKRFGWHRVHEVMIYQWRSIVLSLLVIVQSIYSGTVYVAQTRAAEEDAKATHNNKVEEWAFCLVKSKGDKDKCLGLAKVMMLEESVVLASLFMASMIGLFTFCLMIRRSMISGWWALIRNPRRIRPDSGGDWIIMHPSGWKRPSFGKGHTPKNSDAKEFKGPRGVLPSPGFSTRQMSVPEPGDVTKRHETTNFLEYLDEKEGEGKKGRSFREQNRV